jgi:hypothetical protein
MISRHFLLSSIVTAITVGLFAIFVFKNGQFEISEEYQLIPNDFVLPKGCDIRIDMQTGETWAKIGKTFNTDNTDDTDNTDNTDDTGNTDNAGNSGNTGNTDKSIIANKEQEEIDSTTSTKIHSTASITAPEYKNITKSRIQSRLSAEMQANLEVALVGLTIDNESWDFLEDEAAAMEFGLAILESKNFNNLREFLGKGNEKALQIISISLQNNPLAIEKFVELEIHSKELKNLLETEKLTEKAFKTILRILESFKIHGKDEKFIETLNFNIKKHLKEHAENLQERYTEIIELLIK